MILNEQLNGYDNGFGLLSGRIWRYQVGSRAATRCTPVNSWAVALAGWAAHVRGGRLGHAEDSTQKPNSYKNTFFFFSKQFYKLQINLNSNQI
jgi:hypothetical protein